MKYILQKFYNNIFNNNLSKNTKKIDNVNNNINNQKNTKKNSIVKTIQKKNNINKKIQNKKNIKNKNLDNNEKIEGKVIKKKRKENIPKAIREQVWLKYIGKKFSTKCHIVWCKNNINCFNFDCGHNIPESKGGELRLNNLRPICRNCNVSMGASYSIDEWNSKFRPSKRWYFLYLF